MSQHKVPPSPEEYPADVREELEQHEVTHEGEERDAPRRSDEPASSHLGAVETEPTPVTPPMDGPSQVTEGTLDDAGIEPREELHGG